MCFVSASQSKCIIVNEQFISCNISVVLQTLISSENYCTLTLEHTPKTIPILHDEFQAIGPPTEKAKQPNRLIEYHATVRKLAALCSVL